MQNALTGSNSAVNISGPLGLVTTACTCANHTMKTWLTKYLVPRPSPWKRGPEYEAKHGVALYLGPLFCREDLGKKYHDFMVRLAHVHAVVTRPLSVYNIRQGLGWGYSKCYCSIMPVNDIYVSDPVRQINRMQAGRHSLTLCHTSSSLYLVMLFNDLSAITLLLCTCTSDIKMRLRHNIMAKW